MSMTTVQPVVAPKSPLDHAFGILERLPAGNQQTRMLALARKLLDHHHLWDWSVGTHTAKTYWGYCRYNIQRITLQSDYALHGPVADVVDTILHEIAHALVGKGHGHGPKWRAMARKIGAKPKSCKATKMPDHYYKWILSCPSACGVALKYHRKPPARTVQFRRCRCTLHVPMLLSPLGK
jgi:predicted SprT family Zn-dependent metalloprotease